jgi:peroxiredoxin
MYPSKHIKGATHMANIAVGEMFPAFILPDEHGEPFDLRSELANGPLMLVFYRGDW